MLSLLPSVGRQQEPGNHNITNFHLIANIVLTNTIGMILPKDVIDYNPIIANSYFL